MAARVQQPAELLWGGGLMLRLQDIKTSSGITYSLQALPATRGLAAFTSLMRIVGEPAGHAAAGLSQSSGDVDIGESSLGQAVGALTSRLSEPGTIELVKELLADLQKHEPNSTMSRVNFDMEFAQNYGVLVELIAFAVELNFSSFLGASAVATRWGARIQGLIKGA